MSRIEQHQRPAPSRRRSKAPSAPVFDPTTFDPKTFNPNDPTYLADPYPTYAWFREHEPVAALSVIPTVTPPVHCTRIFKSTETVNTWR